MVCKNCGKELQNGEKFCDTCGWKVEVEEPVTEAPKAEEAVATEAPKAEEAVATEAPKAEEAVAEARKAETVQAAPQIEIPKMAEIPVAPPVMPTVAPATPAKEKKTLNKKAALIIGAVVAVLVLVLVGNWSLLANAMKKTFSSPEKYYQWVEENTVEDAAKSAASIYSGYLLDSLQVYDMGGTGEVTLKLDEAGQDMLSLAGLAGYDLSWLQSVTLSYEGYNKGLASQANVGVSLGKNKLASFDAIVDMKSEAVYMAIPELSKTYIGVEMDEMDVDMDADDAQETLDAFKAICKKLPQEKQVQKLMSKYFKLALSAVEDVEMKNGKELKAEGISQTCTRLEVTIDSATLADMMELMFEEMEEDKEIEKIIVKFCNELSEQDIDGLDDIDAEDIYEEFQDACADAAKMYGRYNGGDSEELVMTLYVDNKGVVRGRTIEIDDVTVKFLKPHKGSKFGYEASVTADGETVALAGTGKESGGKVSGEFALEYNGTGIVDIAVKKFDTDALMDGNLKGGFTFKAGSGIGRLVGMSGVSMLEDLALTVNMDISAKKASMSVALAEDDESWGSFSIASERKNGKKISVPSEKKTVFVEDAGDFEDYWETIDWDGFIKNLDKSDLPSEYVEIFEDLSDLDEDEILEELYYMDLEDLFFPFLFYERSSADMPTLRYDAIEPVPASSVPAFRY